MILNSSTHYLNQTTKRLQELGRVPEMRRAEHFLSEQLVPADRTARNALRLKVEHPKVQQKLAQISRKIDDMRRVLEGLKTTDHNLSRSLASRKRAGQAIAETTIRSE